jgi:uroporphyrinogen-III decarboxylase
MKKYQQHIPVFDTIWSTHWGVYIRGQIALRNDSAVNLSGEQYNEFVLPYDKIILDKFNGGIIHYCGKGDHLVKSMCSLDSLYGIHLSQPHLNNMECVFSGSVDQGKRIVWLDEKAVEATARPLYGRVNKGIGSL